MKTKPVHLTAAERSVSREALAQLLAGENDLTERQAQAAESASEKLARPRDTLLPALKLAVKLLRQHADPEDLGGSRFDLTDCKAMKPIFAALAAHGGEPG